MTVTQAMRHREVGGGSPPIPAGGAPNAADMAMPDGYNTVKSNFMDSQNDSEPAACPDSMKIGGAGAHADNEKIRLIQAKEIVQQQNMDGGGHVNQMKQQLVKTQERNQLLEERLAEADELIGQMTKLIDISRNKQLQKKLINYNETYPEMTQDEINVPNTDQEDGDQYTSPPEGEMMGRGGAPLQQKARH